MTKDFSDANVVNGIPVLSYLPNEAPLRLVPADQNRPKQKIISPSANATAAAAAEPEVGQFEDSDEAAVEAAAAAKKLAKAKVDLNIAAPVKRGEKVDMCCQTMSTGPILATGIFMDE